MSDTNTIKVERNTNKQKVKLNHLVETIKTLELVPQVDSVQVLEDGFSLSSFNKLVGEVFSLADTPNSIIMPAFLFFTEDILLNIQFLSNDIYEYLETAFDELGFKMMILTNLVNEGPGTFYFVSITDNEKLFGFTIKLDENIE